MFSRNLLLVVCILSAADYSHSALRLHWVDPLSGSFAGGTRVYVHGSGFSTDSYTGSNLVFFGDIPCDVVWYTVTAWRLECITRPYPGAVEGMSPQPLRPRVISGGVQATHPYVKFEYRWQWYTPQVLYMLPSTAPASDRGSLIEIAGYRIRPTDTSRYWRFFLGNQLCDHWNDETRSYLGMRPYIYSYAVKCRVRETTPGAWNATVKMNIGTTWNNSRVMMLGYDGKLSMFELYPDIHKVSPVSGSAHGGTLLTITGFGFGDSKDDVTVDIAGIPCEVVSCSISEIKCWTGVPTPGSNIVASVVDGAINFTGVESGFRFEGGRGVRVSRSRDNAKILTTERVAVFPSFEPRSTNDGEFYNERHMAYFTPVQSGLHTFFVAADDSGELYTAANNNISNLTMIASCPPYVGWDKIYKFSQQRSSAMALTAGESLLLVADHREGCCGDFLQVGVLLHDTNFYHNETAQSIREEQFIEFDTAGHYDNQQLLTVVNLTAVDPNMPPEFVVAWGNRSAHITFEELKEDKNAIPSAVYNLFSGSCDFGQELGVLHYNKTINHFEQETSITWRSWGSGQPEIVEDQSLCGRRSLMIKDSRALYFDSSATGFRTTDFPFLCTAYKIPSGLPVSAAVQIKNYGWRSIAMTTTRQSYPSIGHWDDAMMADSVISDDQWHYGCTNVHSLLQTGISTNNTAFIVTGFGFYDHPDPLQHMGVTFYVDELSFSSEKRHLNTEKYLAPTRPNGLALHKLLNTTSVQLVNNTLNVSSILQLVPTSCDHNVPLMTFSLANNSAPGVDMMSVTRVQSASPPLAGTYSLGFKGHWTMQLPVHAPTMMIKEALESLPSVEEVSVWYAQPHSKDLLKEFCPWRRVYVRFERSPGDQPPLQLNTSNTTGEELLTTVQESVTGGLLLLPIPGHMLQTAETTPQVHVKVKGQRAACLGGHPQYSYHDYPTDYCGFAYQSSVGPVVSNISSSSVSIGATITVQGTGFSAVPANNFVKFGEVECSVTVATETMLQCTLGSGRAGAKPLYLHVLTAGVAETGNITLNIQVTITSVAPTMSGLQGGVDVTISGSGFATSEDPQQGSNLGYTYSQYKVYSNSNCSLWENRVTIDGQDCAVKTSSATELLCVAPAGTAGAKDVIVTVRCTDAGSTAETSQTLSAGFTYDATLAPTVTAINPTQGSGRGGETVTITGTGFSAVVADNSVKLGDAICTVQTATATEIVCQTTPHSHGSVPVTVSTAGKGKAMGTVQYNYILQITGVTGCSGSLFGGHTIGIDGNQFGTSVDGVVVAMGNTPCAVQSINDTQIVCTTTSSASTHHINNNARNPEYGLGYAWEPASLTITAGDSVRWSWTGSAFTPTKQIVQVEGPSSLLYNGYGFQSDARVTGHFTYTFTTPGTYHYITKGLAHIGFRGNITVVPPSTKSRSLTVTLNGAPAEFAAGSICGVSPNNQYTFSNTETPYVDSISPLTLHQGDTLSINVSGISSVADDNVLTIGGKPCVTSSHTSTVKTMPDVALTTSTYTNGIIAITCTVPDVPPGRHRLLLHTAGRGWGFGAYNDTTVTVTASVISSLPSSGSLRGGLIISFPFTGIPTNFISHTHVTIGNTPCLLQEITSTSTNPQTGNAVCLTQPSRDDGYSSLIKGTSLLYWSLQSEFYAADGQYTGSETSSFRSYGSIDVNAVVKGMVTTRENGISGNQITDQSALFNRGYLAVQSPSEFARLQSFSFEAWLKVTPTSPSKYRPIVSSYGIDASNIPYGFLLLLNPCNQLEYWLSKGLATTSTTPLSSDCSLISGTSACPSACTSGRIVYTTKPTLQYQLPEGVWHVVTGGPVLVLSEQEWVHVVFGFEVQNLTALNSADNCFTNSTADRCSGKQVLYVNNTRYDDDTVYRHVTDKASIEIGGTSIIPSSSDGSSQLGHFTGYLDEVAVYNRVLTSKEVNSHHHFGSSAEQPVTVTTDALGVGTVWNQDKTTWEPVFNSTGLTIDWDSAGNATHNITDKEGVYFSWTGLHGLWEVTRSVHSSCDLRVPPIKVWAPKQKGGGVMVGLETGRSYFFVDPVGDNCHLGRKVMVSVGAEVEIEWVIGNHDDITITEGTGLLFRWSGSVLHDIIEMSSPQSVADCSYVKDQDIGKVVKAWQATRTVSGNVAVTGLSVGRHYFVCSVDHHCESGMRFTVTVMPAGGSAAATARSAQVHIVPWRIQQYLPLTITEGETLQFAWNAFHSLHQVTEQVYTSCNTAEKSLYIWGEPSVDNSAILADLTPGTYYFICTISGHCDAGMKLQVTVTPRDVPVLCRPLNAVCVALNGLCSFTYSTEETPELITVEPNTLHGGGTLTLSGRKLLSATATATVGSLAVGTVVWVGNTPCTNVVITNTTDIMTRLECNVTDQESGYYSIDVHVSGKGYASLSPSPLTYGPTRNASISDESYPRIFLSAKVLSISPANGSVSGGTLLTVTGSGFSHFTSRVNVSIGSIPCKVVSTSLSEIVCRTGPSTVTSDSTMSLNVHVNGHLATGTGALQYEYTNTVTPTITSLTPGTSLNGGETVQIMGTGFSTTASDVQVQVLSVGQEFNFDSGVGVACTVTAANDTQVTCTAPTLSAGPYSAVVHISGRGLSRASTGGAGSIVYALSVSSFTPTEGGHGGGLELTITGNGFPTSNASSVTVSMCLIACRNVRVSSSTELTCRVDPSGAYVKSNTGCPVTVSYAGSEATSTGQFSFKSGLTTQLFSVSPLIGGTGGGTNVTITGSGFLPGSVVTPAEDDIIVTIDSAVCQWYNTSGMPAPTDTSISCRSSQHRTIPQAEVKVFIKGKGLALTSTSIYYQYIDLWSSRYTWGGLDPPREGESVHIKSGQTVYLDVDTPVLNLILIEGSLIFYDEQDVHFQAKYIFVNSGQLQIGTEEKPFCRRAIITLHGNVIDPEIPIYGAKVIGVRQGELDFHGCCRNITWTRLADTALNGSSVLHLQQPVDWVSGDEIVIAPTTRDGNETEVSTILNVSSSGFVITIATPLTNTHHGVTERYENGQYIDIRAEVGLLSHNVVVQGSQLIGDSLKGLGADQYGGQVFIHRTGPHPTPIRIEHTEFRYMGQAFRLGRYAIHFHLSGSMNGSYLRNCAIHHSHNRALTVHGVHDIMVEGNVAYDIKGHTFFVEDGIETNNYYRHNLGVLTRSSSSLLNTDQLPATFWITNPQNTFTDNTAVASRAYGFWYDLDNHPSGSSHTTSVCPNKMAFGTFQNNVAHSCGEFGLRIWERYTPYVDGCAQKQPDNATLYNFTSYANGIHGVELSVVGNVRLVGFKIADNRDNGIEIQETLGNWGGAYIKDTLIVSHTSANTFSASTGGIEAPNTPGLLITNVTFAAFNLPNTACLRACSHCKTRQGGFQVWTEKLSFVNNSASYKAAFKWEHEVLFHDLDGSLTGHVGGWATPNSGLHPLQYCTRSVPEFSVSGAVNGSVCTNEVYFLRMAWNKAQPLVTLKDVEVNVTNQFGSSLIPWLHYRLTHMDGYMFTLPSTYSHTLSWLIPSDREVDITSYSAGMYGLRSGDYITITHHFVMVPDHVNIGGNRVPLAHVPTNTDSHLSWHINNISNTTTYLISGVNHTDQYFNLLWGYSYEPCPVGGCPDPPDPDAGPLENNQRRWSDPDSWPSGELPKEGEDVTIASSWRMLLDITPPTLHHVFVYGELQFEDRRDYNFTASLILVRGVNSHLIIGKERSPFTHRATITLTGVRNDNPLSLGNQVILGSKAIGIFGNVSLYGQPRAQSWTRLASNATAGSTQIHIRGNGNDWLVGDQIAIASSSYEPTEAEIRTISSFDPATRVIGFNEPLLYDHLVHKFLSSEEIAQLNGNSSWWGDGGEMAPEVGLLSRNIVIQGGENEAEPLEEHYYGCRILIGHYRSSIGVQYTGFIRMDSVEVRHCGQGGYHSPRDPRYSIAFRNCFDRSAGSYIRGCSIHHGYNTAIGVHTSNGVQISDNVVYRTTGSSIQVGGAGSVVIGNLAMVTSTVQPNRPKDNHAVDFPATYDIDRSNTVRDNAAAGSNRISFRYGGEQCHDDQRPKLHHEAMFWNNTAHSGLIGLVVLGVPYQCTSIAGLTATHHWDYSIFSSTASSLVASYLRLAIGKVGVNLNVFGPDPVAHLLGDKSVTLLDSLIVGSLPGQTCSATSPSHVIPKVSFGAGDDKLGIMMSCFNKKRSKMDGTGRWHLMKQYPVIDGISDTVRVTFARFQDTSASGCGYKTAAIGNNPLSPDAVHPLHMKQTSKLSVHQSSLVLFYDPDPAWIVQEDCIDMDCDGPKHSLIRDIDGTFLDTSPHEGSVVPYAELRFDNYIERVPVSWRDFALPGPGLASPSDVVDQRGVARGHPSDFNASSGGCQLVESWNAYRCQRLRHLMLVVESMDADTEVRRLSPIALVGGDTGEGTYTDLINGPMDHGWCTHYTCLKRLSTFFTLVATGTVYNLWSTGSLPGNTRFHLLNAESDELVMMRIWFKNPLRKDVYRNGIFIEPSNVEYEENGITEQIDDSTHIPSLTDHSGTNYFERSTQILYFIIKGSDSIEIRSPPVIRISFNLAVTIDDFFTTYLINNLAFVLGIEPSHIRVVKVVAEDIPRGRRSLLAVNSNSSTVVLELGEPAEPNITEPVIVMVEEQLTGKVEEKNETSKDSVDVQTPVSNTVPSANPLNDDTPANENSFAAEYNSSAALYADALQTYINQVAKLNNITVVADKLITLVQTGSFTLQNATILGVSVFYPPIPDPPTPPVIPPEFNETNVTLVSVSDPPPSTAVPIGGGGDGGEISFSILTRLNVSKQPEQETGHLVHIIVAMVDRNGRVARNLGLTSNFTCAAVQLIYSSDNEHDVPRLEGKTNITFINGFAEFTRLRVDRPFSDLRIYLRTYPGSFSGYTNVFTVVAPSSSVDREQVTFTLVASKGEIPDDYDLLKNIVKSALGAQLDIDISRVTDIRLTMHSGRLIVSVTLLERISTDPPDVPTLNTTLSTLEQLVNTQQLMVTIGNSSLVALPGSFSNAPKATPIVPILLIIVVASSAGSALVAMATMCLFCLCAKNIIGFRRKKSTVDPGRGDFNAKSHMNSCTNQPLAFAGDDHPAFDYDTDDDDEDFTFGIMHLPHPQVNSSLSVQLPMDNSDPSLSLDLDTINPSSQNVSSLVTVVDYGRSNGRSNAPVFTRPNHQSSSLLFTRNLPTSVQQKQSVSLAALANQNPSIPHHAL